MTTANNNKNIAIVIPVYNEEGNLLVLVDSLQNTLNNLNYNYTILFVNDGSTDNSANTIKQLAAQHNFIQYIFFSRNFGHQQALQAGLNYAKNFEAVISMDADMQHPPTLLPQLLQQWENGYEVVYTIREDDKNTPLLKRTTSSWFYKLINKLSNLNLSQNTADFRLMDKKVIDSFNNFTEADIFIRGMISWMGFKQIGINYTPEKRFSGKTKYTFKKMVAFALQGITSFSVKPLHTAIYLGFFFSILALLYIPYVLYSLYFGHTISGWASLIVTVAFFGGLQLMILGIIGLYLGKLFMQTKQRPSYIVSETNISNV